MESIWSQSCKIRGREPLTKDINCEVAVIGAGMAGVLIAYALQRAGHQVIVLEANQIASGQTRNTTAKITSQHGLIYHKLIKSMGEDRARMYAQANEAAIREYERIIRMKDIQCDFELRSNFVYSIREDQLRLETEAAGRLGIPSGFVSSVSLPVTCAGAVRFDHQAQFHPLKFISAIADELKIYEHTSVVKVEDDLICTDRGNVRALYTVFASHYPFINFPGMYFTRMHQERSYVLALKNAPRIDGMWVSEETNGYSFRNYGDLLLLGGGGHRTGDNVQGGRYDDLRQKAKSWYPDAKEVTYWSAQDCIPPDHVPYIGRYCSSRPNWFVATGFQKWGMSSSMVSAMVIRDLISGEQSSYAEVFRPERIEKEAVSGITCEVGHAIKGLSKSLFQIPIEKVEEIPAGHSGIVSLDGEKVGIYKDHDGKIYPVQIKCSHLGCQLEWNPDELSWDCPCHGSRFDRYGNVICGPAQRGLEYKNK